jgi:hypothetical protein
MVEMHRTIGIDMHKRASLVEMGECEGNAELDWRQRQSPAKDRVFGIEGRNLAAPGTIVRGLFEPGDDLGRDVIPDLHAIGRGDALAAVEIDLPHVERVLPGLNRDCLHHPLGKQHALRPAKTPEGGV